MFVLAFLFTFTIVATRANSAARQFQPTSRVSREHRTIPNAKLRE
jgi:hypothetical protein